MEGAPTKILGRANLRLKTRERIYEMVSIKVISVYFRKKFRYAVEDSYPKETRQMKPCTGKVDFLTCLSHRFTNFPLTALSSLRGVAVDQNLLERPTNVILFIILQGMERSLEYICSAYLPNGSANWIVFMDGGDKLMDYNPGCVSETFTTEH